MEKPDKAFGNRVKLRIHELGIKQKVLSDSLGIAEGTLSRYIAGTRIPKGDDLVMLARALSTTATFLLGEDTAENTINDYRNIKAWLNANNKNLTNEQRVELAQLIFQDKT